MRKPSTVSIILGHSLLCFGEAQDARHSREFSCWVKEATGDKRKEKVARGLTCLEKKGLQSASLPKCFPITKFFVYFYYA